MTDDKYDKTAREISNKYYRDGSWHANELTEDIAAALRAEASKRVVGPIHSVECCHNCDTPKRALIGQGLTECHNPQCEAYKQPSASCKFIQMMPIDNLTLAPREACGCELVLPDEKDINDSGIAYANKLSLNDSLAYVRGARWHRDEIKALNPSLKVRDKI